MLYVTIGKKRPVISVPPTLGYLAGWILGKIVGDVMITHEEIKGLMADLLYVDSPPRRDHKVDGLDSRAR